MGNCGPGKHDYEKHKPDISLKSKQSDGPKDDENGESNLLIEVAASLRTLELYLLEKGGRLEEIASLKMEI